MDNKGKYKEGTRARNTYGRRHKEAERAQNGHQDQKRRKNTEALENRTNTKDNRQRES